MKYSKLTELINASDSIKNGLDSKAYLYNLSVGASDLSPPNDVTEIFNDFYKAPLLNYQPSKGSLEALKNIHKIILRNDKEVDYEKNIILSSGAKNGIYLSLKTITNSGDNVMILQPYWLSYPEICKSLNLKYVDFEINIKSLSYDIDDLKNNLLKKKINVLILNNPNNPIGLIIKNQEIEEICEFCKKNKIWVIIDEVYKDLIFSGDFKLHHNLNKHNNIIKIGSLSKSLALPGLRLGYIAGNTDFIRKYNLINQHVNTCINSFSTYVLSKIKKKTYDNFTDESTLIYKSRYDLASRVLKKQKLQVLKSDSSFYILVKVVPKYRSVNDCIKYLNRKKISVTRGINYGTQFKDYIRICLILEESKLKKVLSYF